MATQKLQMLIIAGGSSYKTIGPTHVIQVPNAKDWRFFFFGVALELVGVEVFWLCLSVD